MALFRVYRRVHVRDKTVEAVFKKALSFFQLPCLLVIQ